MKFRKYSKIAGHFCMILARARPIVSQRLRTCYMKAFSGTLTFFWHFQLSLQREGQPSKNECIRITKSEFSSLNTWRPFKKALWIKWMFQVPIFNIPFPVTFLFLALKLFQTLLLTFGPSLPSTISFSSGSWFYSISDIIFLHRSSLVAWPIKLVHKSLLWISFPYKDQYRPIPSEVPILTLLYKRHHAHKTRLYHLTAYPWLFHQLDIVHSGKAIVDVVKQ